MRARLEIMKYLRDKLKKPIDEKARMEASSRSGIVQVVILEVLLDIREELVKNRKPLVQIEPTKLSKEQVEKLLKEIS